MVIDKFHTIHFTILKLSSKFHNNVNTLTHIGMIYQSCIFALHIITQFTRFLRHLTSYGIDLYTALSKILGICIVGALHEFDDIRIKTTTKR